MTAVVVATIPAQLTLEPAWCTDCGIRTHTPVQARRWPHLRRHRIVVLDDGRCPDCAELVALAAAEAAAELAAAQAAERARLARIAAWETRRAAQAAAAAEAQAATRVAPPTAEQQKRWAAQDAVGRRGLRRTTVRGIVRWVSDER